MHRYIFVLYFWTEKNRHARTIDVQLTLKSVQFQLQKKQTIQTTTKQLKTETMDIGEKNNNTDNNKTTENRNHGHRRKKPTYFWL